MKDKVKIISIILAVIFILFGIFAIWWHFNIGNKDIFDTYSNVWTYAEVKMPDGTIKEGKVKNWADYHSDAVKIVFEDGTEVLTSYNCAVMSNKKVLR